MSERAANPLTADDVIEQERLERGALLASFLVSECRRSSLSDQQTDSMLAAWAADWFGHDAE